MKTSNLAQAILLVVVAVGATVATALGVFARGDGAVTTVTSVRGIPYEVAASGYYAFNSQRVVAEGVGWDAFTLAVAIPLLIVAAWLVAHESIRGRLFALGLLGYFLYMYLEYSVTWAFGPLYLLYVAIAAASLVGLLWLGATAAQQADASLVGGFPRRSWAVLSVGMSTLLTVMWLGRIVGALQSDAAADAALFGGTTMTVQALDLILVVPLLVISAVMAWRQSRGAVLVGSAIAVTFVAMALAITAMMISAGMLNGAFEWPPIVIFGAAALAGIVIGYRMYAAIVAQQTSAEVGLRVGVPLAAQHR
jgi:hypothetical protein